MCVADMLSKKRDSPLMKLFSNLICYRVDRNVTPQYSPSLLRPFFFVLPSCNTQAAFKKLDRAEQGMENSQATQQNYHLWNSQAPHLTDWDLSVCTTLQQATYQPHNGSKSGNSPVTLQS